jgi:hypothetical protein
VKSESQGVINARNRLKTGAGEIGRVQVTPTFGTLFDGPAKPMSGQEPARENTMIWQQIFGFKVDRMSDFTSEDDLNTFKGWLKYQLGDTILPPDQLEIWRSMYEECKPPSSLGLMNLKPLRPGEYRYAVALRDGSDLWLTLWVRRDPKGDVYVLVPRTDGGWDPHTSYHRDGRMHSKSYGMAFGIKQLQPLTSAFRGTEHLGMFAGHSPKNSRRFAIPPHSRASSNLRPGC